MGAKLSLMTLSQSLLDKGRMGLITLDPDWKVDACYGSLASSFSVGCRASEMMPVLTGLDDILDDIVQGRRAPLKLPRVALEGGRLADKVLSFEIMPSEPPNRLQILIRDETELAALEQNVLQQRNELALANQALEEARQRAEAALREKSVFLANISHDLKTPLQVIMGNAEILRGDLPEVERDGFLQDVLDNSNFLLALITDLLEASALEAGQLRLIEEPIEIRAMLERVVSMARQMPNGSKRFFELDLDGSRNSVVADPMRLQRLLLNVVGNAVKYTDDGGHITVGVDLASDGDIIIEIEDDGCGIEPDLAKRVFEPFIMGGSGEGSGLGLHIAKGLADLHDAELALTSKPGVGTKASLRLPRSRVVEVLK